MDAEKRAERLIRFAEKQLGLVLAGWQKQVIRKACEMRGKKLAARIR